jgi:hypothetical protein
MSGRDGIDGSDGGDGMARSSSILIDV